MKRGAGLLLLAALLAIGTATKKVLGQAILVEIARRNGFRDPDLAAAVALAESGGRTDAVNIVTKPAPGNLPERSYGLWQINVLAHPQYSGQALLDPDNNARAAFAISNGGTDWSHWSTFKDGRYKKYLPKGRAA